MAVKKSATRLESISIRDLEGLSDEDIRELQDLGIGSLKGIMDEMDTYDGDLTQMSNGAIVISKEQSGRIGDAVLAHSATPESFKKNYDASLPATAPAPAPPPPTNIQPSGWKKFWSGLNPFS